VAAHRGASSSPHHAGIAPRRTCLPTPVFAKTTYRNRQTATLQPQQASTQTLPQPTGISLCLIFPGQPCAFAGTTAGDSLLHVFFRGEERLRWLLLVILACDLDLGGRRRKRLSDRLLQLIMPAREQIELALLRIGQELGV